ncbi:class I SAM-dependent methyltransferase [Opitutales bacterium]|nr:class I SAM-dependent methyltransferase [Opitutales bacterium]
MGKVSSSAVLDYFSNPKVLDHYQDATDMVGLWKSEKIVFSKTFPLQTSSILEIGCGVGRISFGLWSLGYTEIVASDFSKSMIKRATFLNKKLKYQIQFIVEDAKSLIHSDCTFDGVIFGFNGLMQIPGRENRILVMQEAYRVLRKDGYFVFTTHDRTMPKWKKFWTSEKKRWKKGDQNPELLEFGDRYEDTDKGKLYIHVPEVAEVRADLQKSGFTVERDILKSKICEESKLVNEFSDDCRFWIARKK